MFALVHTKTLFWNDCAIQTTNTLTCCVQNRTTNGTHIAVTWLTANSECVNVFEPLSDMCMHWALIKLMLHYAWVSIRTFSEFVHYTWYFRCTNAAFNRVHGQLLRIQLNLNTFTWHIWVDQFADAFCCAQQCDPLHI